MIDVRTKLLETINIYSIFLREYQEHIDNIESALTLKRKKLKRYKEKLRMYKERYKKLTKGVDKK